MVFHIDFLHWLFSYSFTWISTLIVFKFIHMDFYIDFFNFLSFACLFTWISPLIFLISCLVLVFDMDFFHWYFVLFLHMNFFVFLFACSFRWNLSIEFCMNFSITYFFLICFSIDVLHVCFGFFSHGFLASLFFFLFHDMKWFISLGFHKLLMMIFWEGFSFSQSLIFFYCFTDLAFWRSLT